MLLEDLPTEILFEIFSYIHPTDLYLKFLPLSNSRLSYVISHIDISLDLTYISYKNFLLILTYCSPLQIVFLRLTNQYSHGLLIIDFFSSNYFHPNNFLRLRSLYLDDIIGNEIDCLPPYLEKLYIKFHKKAKYAAKFSQLILQSTSLKQCFIIGGYAYDNKTCLHISSKTIEQLHIAIKTFPNDFISLLQALPCLKKLKTRVYSQSTEIQLPSSFTFPLTHLNIDLQGSGIHFDLLNSQLLSYLPRLQSLIYHSYGKSNEDIKDLIQLSKKLKHIQFIRKGLSTNTNITEYNFNNDLVTTIQEITNSKTSRRSLTLHTIPYPDKILNLPFVQWDKVYSSNNNIKHILDQNIYNRVEHVRINLSENSIPKNFPLCQNVKNLTLISTNEINNLTPHIISTFISLSSIRHLIINTQISLFNLNELFSLMSIHSLDISWSQIRSDLNLLNIKNLSLISECISWKEIQYLIIYLIPNLEHLQMNVTTSDECRKILNFLLSHKYKNNLISIKICICQTLSDQIEYDLKPIFLSSQWIKVKWKMDNWYLYIWK